MDQIIVDVNMLRALLQDYGVKDTVVLLIKALDQEADEMSDMGLKEKSIQAADMADVLSDLVGEPRI